VGVLEPPGPPDTFPRIHLRKSTCPKYTCARSAARDAALLVHAVLRDIADCALHRTVGDFDLSPFVVAREHFNRRLIVDFLRHKTLPDPAEKTRRPSLVLQTVNLIERGLVRIKRDETITPVGDQLMATARECECPGENQPLETLAEAHIDSSAADYA
jgi:hypothetical protein